MPDCRLKWLLTLNWIANDGSSKVPHCGQQHREVLVGEGISIVGAEVPGLAVFEGATAETVGKEIIRA